MSSELEGKLTYHEASAALKNMKNNTLPGSDGYTVEFFTFFWKDIGTFVIRSINEGYIPIPIYTESQKKRYKEVNCIIL